MHGVEIAFVAAPGCPGDRVQYLPVYLMKLSFPVIFLTRRIRSAFYGAQLQRHATAI